MNTPTHPDDDLRCAEYALGVLDSDSRRALEREVLRDTALRGTLDAWLTRFTPFTEDLPAIEPPPRVWTRIQRDLGFLPAPAVTSASGGWWNDVGLWRWIGIGASAAGFSAYRATGDFIREFIFPGGMLPSPQRFVHAATKAGLVAQPSLSFGVDYAHTLNLWRQAFESRIDAVRALGFDDTFVRTWRLYLAYCEAGFAERRTDVMQFDVVHGS